MQIPYCFDITIRLGECSGLTAINLGCGAYESDIARGLLDIPFSKLVSVDGYAPNTDRIPKTSAREHIIKTENILDFIKNDEHFDVGICTDVLEHFTKEEGLGVMDWMERNCKKIVIALPLEPEGFHRKSPVPDNLLEEHISHWQEQDFKGRGYATERIKDAQSEKIIHDASNYSMLHWDELWAIK